MKRNKSKKMTIKEELEEPTESAGGTLEDMEVDLDDNCKPDLFQILEDASGLKLIMRVVENSKELCKLLGKGGGASSVSTAYSDSVISTFASELSRRVQKVCEKHTRSLEAANKFFAKISPDNASNLSCDNEMYRTFLKHGMNSAENSTGGASLIGILQAIYSVGAYAGRIENPTLGIQMIVSHSSAPDIFLESHQFLATSHPNKRVVGPKKPIIIKPDPDGLESEKHKEEDTPPQEEKYSEIKTQLLKLWKNLVLAFTKISKTTGTSNDKKILENSVPYLLQMYSATMSESDQEIFQILREYSGKRLQIQIESMPLFGPKSLEPALQRGNNPKASNPLFLHSSRANTVLNLITERQAYQTSMEFRENCNEGPNKNHYDMRFLLPLLCHALDSRNICDAVKVIHNGWIYLIVRGLSVEDPVMRKMAFLAYKLLVENFQLPKKGFKMQDIKVWLHFLLSIRKGLQNLGRCKISNLLSTWIVATWECIRQPTHPLYQRLTTLLFAKPSIDLSVLPDFLPFFNATDGNKATREWIMNVLAHGLQNREDWQVAQKLPTINSLCCSFLVETKVSVQREILMILCRGARLPDVALDMVERYSLLLWIANVPICRNRLYGKELRELFRTLRQNCAENESRTLLFDFVEKKQGLEDQSEQKHEEIVVEEEGS